ncbi:MAG: hypothetical protein DMF86_06055 [Acidobacteria bacterium]|nr:MAG: hypothetical protein DMF86_06055 [Acidobacteriota bacterium]
MKPVEDVFSSNAFRRVVLPGIVLTAGFHPFVSGRIPTLTNLYGIGPTAAIVAEIIVFGLGVSSAIQWIYYVYEGFRLEWITAPAGRIARARVERSNERLNQIYGEREFDALEPSEQASVTKIYEDLLDFPLAMGNDGVARHFAERPTRLGNIIATYELYAGSRYGIDGTFFWNHFLNLAGDTSRKAFDDAYAFAESLVLASFAGAIVALVHLIVLIGFGVGALNQSLIFFHIQPGPAVSAWLALFGLFVWLWFYQVSLPAHRTAGAMFEAIVDGVFPKFVEWATALRVPPSDETIKKVEALNEYLKNLDRPSQTTRRAWLPSSGEIDEPRDGA